MNLYISNVKRESGADALYLEISVLRQTSAHFFLASQAWDTLYLELDDTIPEMCLCFLKDKVKEVRVKLPKEITPHTVKLLAELFPALEGKLRKQFMLGGVESVVLPYLW